MLCDLQWQAVATSLPEPVQNSVVIGGASTPAVPSPFSLPPGVSRQNSLAAGSPVQVQTARI